VITDLEEGVGFRSQYRDFIETILSYTHSIRNENSNREIAIIVPQLIEPRWEKLNTQKLYFP